MNTSHSFSCAGTKNVDLVELGSEIVVARGWGGESERGVGIDPSAGANLQQTAGMGSGVPLHSSSWEHGIGICVLTSSSPR